MARSKQELAVAPSRQHSVRPFEDVAVPFRVFRDDRGRLKVTLKAV